MQLCSYQLIGTTLVHPLGATPVPSTGATPIAVGMLVCIIFLDQLKKQLMLQLTLIVKF